MIRNVFYSWQSDSEPSVNRNLIEDALKRAIRSLRKDEVVKVQPVLDRDTSGLAGSPAIAETIFAKIALADVFVADVTIINPRAKARRLPNPNVLVELGFAVSTLGWDRILLVQNTAAGSPDTLPFDLRGRRVVAYELKSGAGDRTEVRGLLQGRLESALRAALADSATLGRHAGPNVPVWWGNWQIENAGAAYGGHMFIREVGPAGFLFSILVYSGTHTGQLSGYARLVSPDLAYARIDGGPDEDVCEVSFRRSMSDGRRRIEIEEKGGCFRYHGMGAAFTGIFTRLREGLFDSGFLDELDLQRIYSIAGQYFDDLSKCFQGVGPEENLDRFAANVAVGAPRGMYTIMEGIVMRGSAGELWAAFIDGDQVRYFTTEREYREKLPLTIERWRERFQEKEVIFVTDVDRIPKEQI